MKEQVEIGKQVWERYLNGESKMGISKALGVARNEVQSIIKYTTADMYLNSSDLVARHEAEMQALKDKANRIINKKKKEIREVEEELEEAQNTKLSFFGKKVI